jgi:hypothetical protein
MLRAPASLRRRTVNATTAPARQATPAAAAATDPVVVSPLNPAMARAATGRASLAKMFQTPVTSTSSVISGRRKPQEASIVQVTPMPKPAPAGTVLATAVDASVTSSALPTDRPGRAAWYTSA